MPYLTGQRGSFTIWGGSYPDGEAPHEKTSCRREQACQGSNQRRKEKLCVCANRVGKNDPVQGGRFAREFRIVNQVVDAKDLRLQGTIGSPISLYGFLPAGWTMPAFAGSDLYAAIPFLDDVDCVIGRPVKGPGHIEGRRNPKCQQQAKGQHRASEDCSRRAHRFVPTVVILLLTVARLLEI